MLSLTLYSLVGIVGLLAVEGEEGRAAELFAFVTNYPGTPALYKEMAERWFDDLKTKLAPEELDEAVERGKASDLEAIVDKCQQGR